MSKPTVNGDDIAEALHKITSALPAGGEDRPGQLQMAEAVARAVTLQRHLVVQAGTGTGKSLAYLLPFVLAGRKVVVATATTNLQDQLANRDLPLVRQGLGAAHPFRFAVLKGRANYLCRQRAAELTGGPPAPDAESGRAPAPLGTEATLFEPDDIAPEEEPGGDAPSPGTVGGPGSTGGAERWVDQVRLLVKWAETSRSGDRATLDFEPHPRAWSAVSVSARECPGAYRCPSGPDCFAERARVEADAADVVVVNTHLYAAHLASGRSVLPDHDLVVFDEAHAVEEVMTQGLGLELTPGRLRVAAQSAAALVEQDERSLVDAVTDSAERLDVVLSDLVGKRVLRHDGPEDSELAAVLELATGRVSALLGALRRAGRVEQGYRPDETSAGPARLTRAVLVCSHLVEELAELSDLGPEHVAWVESAGPGGRRRVLRAAPVEVDDLLAEHLWPDVTAVLTSATVPPLLGRRLGLPPAQTDYLDVGSPFPYEEHALLYCPTDLPDRRSAEAESALHGELAALVEAAGGRTLALFTSWRAMRQAVDVLRSQLPFPVLAQGDLPKAALLDAFTEQESSCLFATMSFWQGVDVPGPTLSLVAVDRLPFPRPSDPLLQARRERAGQRSFSEIDLPRAATLLAQGAGRLIRSSVDRGVVAVLDRRLAMSGYGRFLVEVLPPMPFTTDRHRVLGFLRAITESTANGASEAQ